MHVFCGDLALMHAFGTKKFALKFLRDIEQNPEDQQVESGESGFGLQERSIDIGVDIIFNALRILVMFEVGFTVVKK